jgi:hypothetical protein
MHVVIFCFHVQGNVEEDEVLAQKHLGKGGRFPGPGRVLKMSQPRRSQSLNP